MKISAVLHAYPMPMPQSKNSKANQFQISVLVMVRKKVGNPADYFDKTFVEYQKGFSARGELKEKSIYTHSFRRELAWP